MMRDDECPVNTWVSIVRRARLGATTKLVAMVVATYADSDGRHVFPGVARLAANCGLGYSTTKRALAKLRDVGLLAIEQRSDHHAGHADIYRLILAEDLLERVDVLTPDQERASMAEILKRQRNYGSLPSRDCSRRRGPPSMH